MTNEKKQEFTRRISQANATELTVILLEMVESYLFDAKESFSKDQLEYRKAISHADDCLVYLQQTLDFRYEVAADLFYWYQNVIKLLMHADIRNDLEALEKAQEIMHMMTVDFRAISQMDHSEPLMEYAEEMYAGLTYASNGTSNEMVSCMESRGFLA